MLKIVDVLRAEYILALVCFSVFMLLNSLQREKLLRILGSLGEILCYHRGGGSVQRPQPVLLHHRMAYVSTALVAVRMLQILVPVEKVRWAGRCRGLQLRCCCSKCSAVKFSSFHGVMLLCLKRLFGKCGN